MDLQQNLHTGMGGIITLTVLVDNQGEIFLLRQVQPIGPLLRLGEGGEGIMLGEA